MERITARAKGRVQGVGYRAHVGECARATGIHGYVKNLPDGTVEFVGEGSPASLISFLNLAYAKHDSFIRVDEIEVRHGPAIGEFGDFRIAW